MDARQIQLPDDWKSALLPLFESPSMAQLRAFLSERKRAGAHIYPPTHLWFHAFHACPLAQTRVVILGQDPYHGEGQAMGLSFSVPKTCKIPPSLVNIFKELKEDLHIDHTASGDLTGWANQGVLLLNACLTVEAGAANSHQGQGWESFTDGVIRTLSEGAPHVVFVLWGSFAQKKARLIDSQKHTVIQTAHPSPLSAYRGFFGSRVFSKINQALQAQGQTPIDWARE